jgi:hypothetical protein
MGFPATFPSMFVNAFSAATKINQTEGCHLLHVKFPSSNPNGVGKKNMVVKCCFYVPAWPHWLFFDMRNGEWNGCKHPFPMTLR